MLDGGQGSTGQAWWLYPEEPGCGPRPQPPQALLPVVSWGWGPTLNPSSFLVPSITQKGGVREAELAGPAEHRARVTEKRVSEAALPPPQVEHHPAVFSMGGVNTRDGPVTFPHLPHHRDLGLIGGQAQQCGRPEAALGPSRAHHEAAGHDVMLA